ncbi:hypothetical protein [Pseudooceanicola sp. HF7]|uniref:hypothetical protein n=1 Tax=Pseudooceanicola sp. HF7 TaxID=2721560 RepID=UPI001430CEEA|nr:hypothetical protein [Pseudooceanicola sp. HF7]NIZ11105.1 hypothetical protein [Pseudooceanicola sp. HF7]
MMPLMMSWGWRALTSRLGLAVIACGLLWGWHLQDRAAAVEAARAGYVRQFELAAAQAELVGLKRRLAAADRTARQLQERMQIAEAEALRFATELEAFERDTTINPDGVVDGDLLRLLRAR